MSERSSAPIRVIAAVIERGGKLLVCQRPLHKRHGGLWEFPGGKLEPEEDDAASARRELREELGLELEAIGAVELEVADPDSHFLIVFLPARASGEPARHEHIALRWADVSELQSLPMAPADRRYVEHRLAQSTTPPGSDRSARRGNPDSGDALPGVGE